MAELSTLARPYARAAFEYAREHDAVSAWADQLATAAAVAASERVAAALDDPSLTDEQQAATLNGICGEEIGTPMQNFVRILAANKRIPLLSEIYSQFQLLKANLEKTVEVEVISAFDLSENMTDRLAQVLGRRLEREVRVSTSTDPALLGGVLIRAGDTVIDGSVRGRLDKLAEALNP